MPSRNRKFLNSVRVLLLGAPLMLAACHSDFGPYPMPTGYTHHDKLYKAPPGPEPVFKKLEHMNDRLPAKKKEQCHPCDNMTPVPAAMMMNAPAGAAADYAANDLLTRLVDGFGLPSEPVYLKPAGMMTGASMAMNTALRNTMMAKGFKLADAPGMGPYTLSYSVDALDVGDGTRSMVTVGLTGGDDILQEVSGIYSLGSGVTVPGPVAMPAPMTESYPLSVDAPAPPPPESEPMPIGPLN